MAVYCVDDGGDGTQDGTTQTLTTLDWSKADTSFANLPAGALSTAGNTIFVGDDHADPGGASITHTFPTTGAAVVVISADRTQTTPTYKVGTTAQFSSLGGNYSLVIDGAISAYGVRFASGSTGAFGFSIAVDDSEYGGIFKNCTFALGANGRLSLGASGCRMVLDSCVINLDADLTTSRTSMVIEGVTGNVTVRNLTFTNPGYRTSYVIECSTSTSGFFCSGVDFSGFPAATEIIAGPQPGCRVELFNCKTTTSAALFQSANLGRSGAEFYCVNCGDEDLPVNMYFTNMYGSVVSTAQSKSGIYRSTGASAETDGTAWLVTTGANTTEYAPFITPYMYGTISSTGVKTFDVYITHDANTTYNADFTDAEVWLEVEYFNTADEANWSLATDWRNSDGTGNDGTITTTPVAQTDDTTSTWNGTGPSFTYKQKLSVSATVNETGQFRARVAVAAASIGANHYFYIDPKVTVT